MSKIVLELLANEYAYDLQITAMFKHGSGVVVCFKHTVYHGVEDRVAYFRVRNNEVKKIWDSLT